MKKLVYLLLFILSVLFNTNLAQANSLEKRIPQDFDPLICQSGILLQDTVHTFEFMKLDPFELTRSFNNEYAHFNSEEEFNGFMYAYSLLEEQERNSLRKLLKYRTYEDRIDSLYSQMDSILDRQEFDLFLDANKEILALDTLDNGDEELYVPGRSLHLMAPFMNSEGIIGIEGGYVKYIGKYVAKAKDARLLAAIHVEESLKQSKVEFKVATLNVNDSMDLEPRNGKNGELGRDHEFELKNDEFWCRKKRKVVFGIGLIASKYMELFGVTIYDINARAYVHAKRKGILCIWYRYKDTITWKDFYSEYRYEFGNQEEDIVWQRNNIIKRAKSLYRIENKGGFVYPNFPYVHWKIIRSKITTDGLNGKWLIVDYQN